MSLPLIDSADARTMETTTEEDKAVVVCDLCGINIYQPTPYGNPVLNPVIRREYGNAANVQVSLTAGEQDWDWEAGETSSFTICPKCFEEKLAAWFELQGVVPKTKSWSR